MNKSINNSVTRNKSVLFYSLLIVLIIPGYVHDLSNLLTLAFIAIRVLAILLSIILLIKYLTDSPFVLCVTSYVAYIGLVTVFHFSPSDLYRYIAIYADIFGVVVLTCFLIKYDRRFFIRIMSKILTIGLIVNFMSIVFFPDGLLQVANEVGSIAPYYLYGYDNSFILYYLPTIAFVYIYEKLEKGKNKGGFWTLFALLISFISFFMLDSVAASIAFGFLFVGYAALRFLPKTAALPFYAWLIFCFISFLLVSGLLISPDSPLMTFLDKDSSLYRRELMWAIGLDVLDNNIIFGTGVLSSDLMRLTFGFAAMHNSFLQTLLWGGILGLFLLSTLFFTMQRELKSCGDLTDRRFYSLLVVVFLIVSFVNDFELNSGIYLLFSLIGSFRLISLKTVERRS